MSKSEKMAILYSTKTLPFLGCIYRSQINNPRRMRRGIKRKLRNNFRRTFLREIVSFGFQSLST